MQLIRTALSTALDTTARMLSLTGSALGTAARLLRSDRDDAPQDTNAFQPSIVTDDAAPIANAFDEADQPMTDGVTSTGEEGPAMSTADVIAAVDSSDVADRIGRVMEPAATPMLDEHPHVRTSESHVEELATRPVADVIRAIDGLSTDELRQLTEYETSHRNRKRVLQAIERALAPAPAGGSSADREIVLPEAGGVPTNGLL